MFISGEPLPAAGFGFGDAVIVELLSDKGLLPKDKGPGVTAVVFAWDAELQVCCIACFDFVSLEVEIFFFVWRWRSRYAVVVFLLFFWEGGCHPFQWLSPSCL